MAKSKLSKKNWVVKPNTLNEMRTYGMTLQELRLFSVYLSKINPRDKNTKTVRFPLMDFVAIMDFKNPNISYFKNVARNLLSSVMFEPLENGGFDAFTIFNRFKMLFENGEWYIDVDANEVALPLLFEFRGHYFKYELWNALGLKSKNQLRMYEILKQYEKTGHRVMTIKELKEQLGIEENEYPRYNDLKSHVLEVCRKALAENTDISFTYEVHKRKGRGGKISELKFIITKNKDYKDPLSLEKFIELNNIDTEEFKNFVEGEYEEKEIIYTENITQNSKINLDDIDEDGLIRSTGTLPFYEERIDYLMTACNNEFSREEMMVLYSIMQQKMPYIHGDTNRSHDYLQYKYREMEMNDKKLRLRGEKINNRFAYFKKILEVS
ncbi:MAG: replication initiation protein [Candidatus Bathyarchaeota archaeon]|nr:replication initiation protein [Candidatus Termiticorpusculum sp.]